MVQITVRVTPAMEEALVRFMRTRGFKTRAEAVRAAIEESLAKVQAAPRRVDFSEWVGLGTRAPQNTSPRFATDAALWE